MHEAQPDNRARTCRLAAAEAVDNKHVSDIAINAGSALHLRTQAGSVALEIPD